MRTAVTKYILFKSTDHQGLVSVTVCVQDSSAYSVLRSPLIALSGVPMESQFEDWLAVPVNAIFDKNSENEIVHSIS